MRDNRRASAYFDEVIKNFRVSMDAEQRMLDDGELSLPDERLDVAHVGFEKTLMLALACYSRGDSRSAIAELAAEALAKREQITRIADELPPRQQSFRYGFEAIQGRGRHAGAPYINRYINALWLLGLVVTTGLDADHRQRALAIIDHAGEDALLDRIALALGETERPIADHLAYPEPYQLLAAAFEAPAAHQPIRVSEFLDAWYDQLQGAQWRETHHQDYPGDYWEFYVGYWSIEAALVVTVLGIDDTDFRNHPYYPAELITRD